MPVEPRSTRPNPPGLANNTSWNVAPGAFAPNTNVLDPQSMPSEQAARARVGGQAYLDASKRRDTEEPHQIIGPAPVNKAGQILPLGHWIDKLTGKSKKAGQGEVLDGQSVRSEATGISSKESKEKGDGIIR